MTLQEIQNLMRAAIECSYFIRPRDPGLTYQELFEIAGRFDLYEGETNDALRHIHFPFGQGRKLLLDQSARNSWRFFFKEEPEFRNIEAFDFIYRELNDRVRKDGASRAAIQREVLVSRGIAAQFTQQDMDVAIVYLTTAEFLTEQDNYIKFYGTQASIGLLPGEIMQQIRAIERKSDRAKAYPLVKDVIERRTDGRAPSAEPFEAFAHRLQGLGYGAFRLWWMQTVAELRVGEPSQAPTSVTVLAAALVEGTLTFVVQHARAHSLPVFKSSDFDGSPTGWRIDKLIESAASGGSDAILDPSTKALAVILSRNRQRIHAGRMLVDHPQGVPDIRIDEVRQARATAEQVVRRVLDWLERHPPG